MTERERLASRALSVGLRLSDTDLDALLPAWKRYLALVEVLRGALPAELESVDH